MIALYKRAMWTNRSRALIKMSDFEQKSEERINERVNSQLVAFPSLYPPRGISILVSATLYPTHNIRLMVSKLWYPTCGMWLMVFNSWYLTCVIRHLVSDSWYLTCCIWLFVSDSWFLIRGIRLVVYICQDTMVFVAICLSLMMFIAYRIELHVAYDVCRNDLSNVTEYDGHEPPWPSLCYYIYVWEVWPLYQKPDLCVIIMRS